MSTSNCTMCKEDKDVSEYYVRDKITGRRHTICKGCMKKRRKSYDKKAARVYAKNYYQKNKEEIKEKNKERYAIKNMYLIKISHMRRVYNLSEDSYRNLVESQKNCCAICGKFFTHESKRTSPNVDHDHDTGGVRELLCGNCNTAIGLLGDSIETSLAVVEYLKKHKR